MESLRGPGCRTILPLIARYNDPDLNDEERVVLSTHLLQCPECRERLETYRAQDQLLRALPEIGAQPRAREGMAIGNASLPDQPTTPASTLFALASLAVSKRPLWSGAAAAVSAVAMIAIVGAVGFSTMNRNGIQLVSAVATREGQTPPLTTTLFAANPTAVVDGVSEAFLPNGLVRADDVARLGTPAIIRAIKTDAGHTMLMIDAGDREEVVACGRDTVVILPDGHFGTVGDLRVGQIIQVQRRQMILGPDQAREVTVLR